MKNRKRDILFLFICTLPVSAMIIYWSIWSKEYSSLPWALLPQAFIAVCIVIMLLQEKLVLKRENKLRTSDDSKHRDSALEKYEYENSGYRNIRSETMVKDLKKVYRTRLVPICVLCGLITLAYPAVSFILLKASKDNEYIDAPSLAGKIAAVLCAIFSALCFITAIYEFLGLPAALFIRKNRKNTEAIERSYMEGKMICGKLCGINVGFEYCVYYDIFSIDCFAVRNIKYADVIIKIKKEKDRSGFYHKIKKDISIK